MSHPLIAIGLDAADYRQLESWMDAGELPVLAGIRSRGTYGRLKGMEYFTVETPWTNFLTGLFPDKHGYWGTLTYDPASYKIHEAQVSCYHFKEYRPFYALNNKRVAVFDPPHIQVIPGVNGIQVMAWGAHSPLSPPDSDPKGLLGQIEKEYGKHEGLLADENDWWKTDRYPAHRDKLARGIELRGRVAHDMLKKEKWDFFYTVFGETHAIGHDYYYSSRNDHPLSKHKEELGMKEDAGLAIAKKIDGAIGHMLQAAPADARVVIFSPHGMRSNQNDLPSLVFLPEMFHRLHFPGEAFFENQPLSEKPKPIILKPKKDSWTGEIWRVKKEKNPLLALAKNTLPKRVLEKLDEVFHTKAGSTFYVPYNIYGYPAWQPATWYQHLWHKMRFFALPSYGDGYVRINLKGREGHGIVEPKDYTKVCDEIEAFLSKAVSGRTGAPMLKKVIRTRKDPMDRDPKLPDGDLIVLWNHEATDVLDHPEAGRVGPVLFNRPGGHFSLGFFMAAGPGIAAKRAEATEDSIHLTSTFLHHMDCPVPAYMDAKKVLF